MAFWRDILPLGPLAYPFVRHYRKQREAEEEKFKGRERKGRREQKKYYKSEKKYAKKAEKTYKKERKFEKKEYLEGKKLAQKAYKKYGGEKFIQKPAITPEQKGLLDYLTKYGEGRTDLRGVLKEAPLYKAGEKALLDLFKTTPEAYEQFKAPIMREFQEQILPGIAGRYAGTGAARSSSLQNALAAAGGNLGERLGALREQLRQSGISQALGYAQQPITNQLAAAQSALGVDPFINIYRQPTIPGMPQAPALAIPQRPPAPVQLPNAPPAPGFLSNLLGGLAPAIGAGAGYAIGGPIGGAIGGGLGTVGAKMFGPQQQQQAAPFNYAMPQRQQMPSFGQLEQQRRFGFRGLT